MIKDIKKCIDFLDSIGKPHYLDEIDLERIRRVARKIEEENPDTYIDLGFKHFVLKEPSQNTLDKLERFDPEDQGLVIANSILEKEYQWLLIFQ